MSLSIRPASPADATHLACFVDMASEGLAAHMWSILKAPGQTLFEFGRSRALREEGSFSYRNGHIAEVDGNAGAGLVGYLVAEDHDPNHRSAGAPGSPDIPPFIQPLVDLEGLIPGYWYVNVLATYPEFRGRGIGQALLTEADRLGRAAGSKGMALIADSGNLNALRLYDRCGYRLRDRRPIRSVPGFDRKGDWLLLARAHS